MSSSVELGSLTLSGGTPRLSGTASELDTASLVESLSEVKRLPAVRYEQRVTENEAMIAAYGDLRVMMSDMQDALEGLRNPPGFFSQNENLFESKAAFFSSDTITSPAELLGVVAENSAQAGSFELIVDQIATARKFSGSTVTDSSAALADELNGSVAFAGSFTIGLEGSGTTATIDVDGTMDLNDIRGAINATSEESGVSASVLKVSDTDYRLVLTAQETGKEIQLSSVGGDNVLPILGLSSADGLTFTNPIQDPDKAIIQIDGITVIRDDNTISDAVDGVTLDLLKAEPSTTVTIDIEQSLGPAKSKIVEFVDSHNVFRAFVNEQSIVGENGELGEGSALFGDSTLRSIAQNVSSFANGQVTGLGADALTSLAGIGITMNETNLLQIDEQKLDDLLISDPATVRDVFEFRFNSSSPDLALFGRTNALNDTEFTINIVDADNDGIAESATIDGIAAEIDGNTIMGADGTDYQGLELIWTGQGSVSIDINATKGVAERLFNYIEGTLNEVDGTLTGATESLEDLNLNFSEEITKIEERVETFRQQLIEKFGAMEAALALSDSMLQQVRATTEAMFADN